MKHNEERMTRYRCTDLSAPSKERFDDGYVYRVNGRTVGEMFPYGPRGAAPIDAPGPWVAKCWVPEIEKTERVFKSEAKARDWLLRRIESAPVRIRGDVRMLLYGDIRNAGPEGMPFDDRGRASSGRRAAIYRFFNRGLIEEVPPGEGAVAGDGRR